MSNTKHEYKPLAQLIRDGLKPGTVVTHEGSAYSWIWNGQDIISGSQEVTWDTNPFEVMWRIVSEPPVEAEWEAEVDHVQGKLLILLPVGCDFKFRDTLQVKAVKK